MKKTLTLVLALLLVIGVSACSKDKKPSASGSGSAGQSVTAPVGEGHNTDDGSDLGIDMTSESIQMTSETQKLPQETLIQFVKEVFGDKSKLTQFDKVYTYGDCKDVLGSDANMYTFEGTNKKRQYYWLSAEADNARLMLVFTDPDEDGMFTLESYYASNINIE